MTDPRRRADAKFQAYEDRANADAGMPFLIKAVWLASVVFVILYSVR